MDVFKAHPNEEFPFAIEGCPTFQDGETCRLLQAAPWVAAPFDGSGDVKVSTTDTSVTFTVVSDGYFDAPGSTITLSTYQGKWGVIMLQQQAEGNDANDVVAAGIALGGSAYVGGLQAEKFREILRR
jgi:hypothetical protein